jgi:hypothetical protein
MTQIFISYAGADLDVVDTLIRQPIEGLGLTTWWDRSGIAVSQDWEKTLRQALQDSQWFLPVLSSNSVTSKWVRREIAWAMDNRSDNIIPVALEPVNLDDWHVGLRTIQILPLWETDKPIQDEIRKAVGADAILNQRAQGLATTCDADVTVAAFPSALTDIAFAYYCYISVSKVNNLFFQLDGDKYANFLSSVPGRIVRTQASFKLSKAPAALNEELGRLQLLQKLTNSRFGSRPGGGAERELAGLESAQTLLPKLRRIMLQLILDENVADLPELLEGKRRRVAYVHRGPHRLVNRTNEGMATIESSVKVGPKALTLRLHASLKYFSDMAFSVRTDGSARAEPHSANHAFFDGGGLAYDLVSFNLITSFDGDVIYGSPVCMLLDSRSGLGL